MNRNFTIGITTFPRRFEMFKEQILKIRSVCDNEILVQVNQFYKIKDEEYRRNILKFCSEISNIFVTIYPTFTSLSKMWNQIVINSSNDIIFSVSDDVNFINEEWVVNIYKELESFSGFKILNNTFSTFLISKNMLDEIGYFDERLLAYGEEDGDFVWRYIKQFGVYPQVSYINNFYNIGEGYGIEPPNLRFIQIGNVIRPAFNRDWCFTEKYSQENDNPIGMFGIPMKCNISNEKQYPYEKFKLENFNRL